jgi:hypothetical protein
MASPKKTMGYGLKWNPNPPLTVPQLVAYALATGIYTILAWLGVIGLPIGIAGVSAFFVAVGFGVPFAMWFGGWGLVMGFIGTTVGAGILSGLPVPVALLFGIGDVVLYGSLLLLYRGLAPRFKVDPLGRDVFTLRGFIFFFIVAGNIPQILGGIYGVGILYLFGFVPTDALAITLLGFWIGNVIVVTVIAPILLRLLGPVVERFGLTNHGWLT